MYNLHANVLIYNGKKRGKYISSGNAADTRKRVLLDQSSALRWRYNLFQQDRVGMDLWYCDICEQATKACIVKVSTACRKMIDNINLFWLDRVGMEKADGPVDSHKCHCQNWVVHKGEPFYENILIWVLVQINWYPTSGISLGASSSCPSYCQLWSKFDRV